MNLHEPAPTCARAPAHTLAPAPAHTPTTFSKGALNAKGHGVYFADTFSKANNYCKCEHCGRAKCDGCLHGEFRLLLCRVTLGKVQVVGDKDRTITQPKAGHHSIVAYAKEALRNSTFAFQVGREKCSHAKHTLPHI